MQRISSALFGLVAMGLLVFLPAVALATNAPFFRMSASEAQGSAQNEFYVGRCFRVNIYVNTGGLNTNGADVEINYNSTLGQIVQSNCSSAATQIYSDGLYNTYPSNANSVSDAKILLSAYNNPGVSVNTSNGLFGHFFVKVLQTSESFPLSFEYTQGVTTDTNLAQTSGDGSDILVAVDNPSLKFVSDSDAPQFSQLSPANNATNVSVDSSVSFVVADAMAGINSSSAQIKMKELGGSYNSQTLSLGSVQTTNANRYYQYTGVTNPNSNIKTHGGYYKYNTTYSVSSTVADFASLPHSSTQVWSFTTENDIAAPYVTSRTPAASASGVATNSSIVFRLKDYKNNAGIIPGSGVDTGSIGISISGSLSGNRTYTCASPGVTCDVSGGTENVLITIIPLIHFSESETVVVTINASDSSDPVNVMGQSTYTFTTEDTAAPTILNISPLINSYGNSATTNIAFDLADSGAGVAIETLQIYVNDILYTSASPEVLISGDASLYHISINPASDFTNNTPVSVRVSVRDQAPSLNYISPNPTLFSFVVGLSGQSGTSECPVVAARLIETQCPTAPAVTQNTCPVCVANVSCEPVVREVIKFVEIPQACSVSEPNNLNSPPPPSSSSQSEQEIIKEALASSPIGKLTDFGSTQVIKNTLSAEKGIVRITHVGGSSVGSNTKVATFTTDDAFIELEGTVSGPVGTVIPLYISPTTKDAAPIVIAAIVDEDGKFRVKLRNIFSPGLQKISSFSGEAFQFVVEDNKIKSDIANSVFVNNVAKYRSILLILLGIIVIFGSLDLFSRLKKIQKIGRPVVFVAAVIGFIFVQAVENTKTNETLSYNDYDKKISDEKKQFNDILKKEAQEITYIQGAIIDPITDRPITNATITVGDQTALTDKKGNFRVKNTASDKDAIISFNNGGQAISVKLSSINNKVYYLNQELAGTLSDIDQLYRSRKFKKVYDFAHSDVKKIVSSDNFVAEKNKLLFGVIQQGAILDAGFDFKSATIKKWSGGAIKKQFNKAVEVQFVRSGLNDSGNITRIAENWHFVQEGGKWRFVQ
jgi:hypothetical protein